MTVAAVGQACPKEINSPLFCSFGTVSPLDSELGQVFPE